MKQHIIQTIIYKAKDGYRWHMKRHGRIIAESGESYTKLSSCKRTLLRLLSSLYKGDVTLAFPTK